MEDTPAKNVGRPPLDQLIGSAVKTHRVLAGLTLAELSGNSVASTAMISKIERGLVSASLGTLEALAGGVGVPLVTFLAGTVERSDVSFMAAGRGRDGSAVRQRPWSQLQADRQGREAKHVSLESFSVTLEAPLGSRPLYRHQGVKFIHVTDGEMVYGCGEQAYEMRLGDSLSFDSNAAHGPIELKTDTVSFVTVRSEAVPVGN